MLYLFGALVAALLIVSGVASCEHKTIVSLEAGIAANKIEAKRLLDAKVAENLKREAEDKAFSITIQGDYERKLKSLSDSNRTYVGQLRDPGRNSSSCTGSQASANTGVSQNSPTGTALSDSFGVFLRGEADRADFAAIYATECRKVALRPSIREQVKELP